MWIIAAAIPTVIASALAVTLLMLRRRLRSVETACCRTTALLETAPHGILRYEASGWHCNPTAAAMLGRPGVAILSTSDFALSLDRLSAETAGAAAMALIASGDAFEMTVETIEDGRIVGLSGFMASDVPTIWLRDDSASAWLAEQFTEQEAEAGFLRSVLDAVPIPVWWRRDDTLSLADGNEAFKTGLGRSDTRNAGKTELVDRSQDLAKLAQRTAIEQTESRHVVFQGERRTLDISETPLPSQVDAIVGYAQDGTALENLQITLAEHVSVQDQVLEQLTTAIAVFGPDRRLKFFNEPFSRLWTLEPTILLDQPSMGTLLEILREARMLPETSDFPAYKREVESLFTGLIDPREWLMHLPDGRTLRVVCSAHPMGGLIFQYEDVTDRLALESSHNTLSAVQRSTLNSLFEGVCVFARDGRLKLFNSVYAEIFGLDPDWLETGPHISDIAEKGKHRLKEVKDWPSLKRRLIHSIAEPKARSDRMETSNGRVLDYAYVPLPDGQCLVLYLDVTDSTQVEAALIDRSRALENADLLKSQFISNVSYELRTPLNAIMGFAELLTLDRVGRMNEAQHDYVGNIRLASEALSRLIGDILDLAAVQADFMEFDDNEINIVAVLDEAIDLQTNGVTYQIPFYSDLAEVQIQGDRARLTQAFQLLLKDAVQYGQGKPNVSVHLVSDPDAGTQVRIESPSPHWNRSDWADHALDPNSPHRPGSTHSTSSDISNSLARSILLAQHFTLEAREGVLSVFLPNQNR